MSHSGGCLCGQMRYEFEGEPKMTAVCHCAHCQKQSGSALSVIICVPEDAVSHSGELKTYRGEGDSGNPVERKFCPECGSPVFTVIPGQAGMLWIKAGTLDDTSELSPQLHLWTRSAQRWVTIPEGAQQLETQ